MLRTGLRERVAKAVGAPRTRAVFERYEIVSEDARAAPPARIVDCVRERRTSGPRVVRLTVSEIEHGENADDQRTDDEKRVA